MRKINYRITVNITQKTMKLGFRAKMPEEMEGTYGTVWEFAGHSDIA